MVRITFIKMNRLPLAGGALLSIALWLLLPNNKSAWSQTSPRLSSGLQQRSFHSASLDREMRYRILLPSDYDATKRVYPVLYLLHGLGDDEGSWTVNTDLASYVRGYSLIVVMPDAAASWYVDSAADPGLRYERYIVDDLRAEVEGHYRADPKRAARAIGGQSMGGYGAIKIALRYPNLFAVAGSFSGALDAAADIDYFDKFGPGTASQAQSLLRILGGADSQRRHANDPFQLLKSVPAAQLPYLYLNCGSGDMQLPANHRFVAQLESHRAVFEFHEFPGEHNWKYWNEQIPAFLTLVAERLQGAK